jgi:hypothetical protein
MNGHASSLSFVSFTVAGHGQLLMVPFNPMLLGMLVESDLFLIPNQGKLVYMNEALKHVIASRLRNPRPVIIEAVAVRRLLSNLALKPDYVIYVSSSDAPESRSLKDEIASYEADFKPATSADLVIDVAHP